MYTGEYIGYQISNHSNDSCRVLVQRPLHHNLPRVVLRVPFRWRLLPERPGSLTPPAARAGAGRGCGAGFRPYFLAPARVLLGPHQNHDKFLIQRRNGH